MCVSRARVSNFICRKVFFRLKFVLSLARECAFSWRLCVFCRSDSCCWVESVFIVGFHVFGKIVVCGRLV